MKKSFWMMLIAGSLMAALLVGCSNKPSVEEMQQLEALKAEVASLEKQVAALESDRATLVKAVAEKDVKINQCVQDKAVVEERLKSMQ